MAERIAPSNRGKGHGESLEDEPSISPTERALNIADDAGLIIGGEMADILQTRPLTLPEVQALALRLERLIFSRICDEILESSDADRNLALFNRPHRL